MLFNDKQKRRSCLLGFTVFLALAPVFGLVWLAERLGHLAMKHKGKKGAQKAGFSHRPCCTSLPMPDIDPDTWRLKVGGEVANPVSLGLDDLKGMSRTRNGLPMRCARGWSYHATWIGVKFSAIRHLVKPLPGARWVEFRGADGYHECASLSKLLSRSAFLADWLNGNPLPREHGAPLRLIFPTRYGYKNVKWLTEIVFRKTRSKGYLDGKLEGYTADGTIRLNAKPMRLRKPDEAPQRP